MAECCEKNSIGCKTYEGDEQRKGYDKYNTEKYIQNCSTPYSLFMVEKNYRITISEGISVSLLYN